MVVINVGGGLYWTHQHGGGSCAVPDRSLRVALLALPPRSITVKRTYLLLHAALSHSIPLLHLSNHQQHISTIYLLVAHHRRQTSNTRDGVQIVCDGWRWSSGCWIYYQYVVVLILLLIFVYVVWLRGGDASSDG